MAKTEKEPLFLPAAICTLAAFFPFILFLLTEKSTILIATGFLWGAGIGLWAENGKRSGNYPWPKSINEYKQMTQAFYQKKSP